MPCSLIFAHLQRMEMFAKMENNLHYKTNYTRYFGRKCDFVGFFSPGFSINIKRPIKCWCIASSTSFTDSKKEHYHYIEWMALHPTNIKRNNNAGNNNKQEMIMTAAMLGIISVTYLS